jgi:hypothetical protein
MKKVYICAPLKSNTEENLKDIKKYAKYLLKCGMAPVVPHFYALCLDYSNENEKELGTKAALSLLWFCDELWVFGDEITDCMQNEIDLCKNLNIRIRKLRGNELNKMIGGK